MKYKIMSDGYSQGTKIIDSETGAPIKGVSKIEWVMDVDNVGIATVTIIDVGMEADIDNIQIIKDKVYRVTPSGFSTNA
jgi:hypothetical protein